MWPTPFLSKTILYRLSKKSFLPRKHGKKLFLRYLNQFFQNTVLHDQPGWGKSKIFSIKHSIARLHTALDKSQLPGAEFAAPLRLPYAKIQAVAQPQAHQKVILGIAAAIRHGLTALHKRACAAGPIKTAVGNAAMRPGAKAPVVHAVPIQKIVLSLKARAGEVADLVLPVTVFL